MITPRIVRGSFYGGIMDKYKGTIIAITGAITSFLGILAVPIYLLLGSNVLDYFTGILASDKRNQEINSSVGINGIKKKISMWVLVIIGAMLDVLLMYATDFVSLEMPFKFYIASVCALWLLCNELISILENLKDMGTKIPPFLKPLIDKIKSQTEEKLLDETGADKND